MKSIMAILFIFFQMVSLEAEKSEIELLFSPQNAQRITNYFGKTIDLNIPSTKGTYSKDQAKIIFNKFLKDKELKKYTKKHSGGGNNRSKFEIGALQFTDNSSYRTYVLYNTKGETVEIIELRIEKE